jgi:predicted secreted protein
MSWYSGLAVYLIMWWVVLFTLLPLGRGSDDALSTADVASGQDAGAPAKPYLLYKFIGATVLSGVLFALFYWAWLEGLLDFRPN